MNGDELKGKIIKSVAIGTYGMCDKAYCIEFTDGSSVTFAGEHDENTIRVDGNKLE